VRIRIISGDGALVRHVVCAHQSSPRMSHRFLSSALVDLAELISFRGARCSARAQDRCIRNVLL